MALSRRTKHIATVAAIVAAAVVLIYIGLFDPTAYPSPRCFMKTLTGWDCPGCGSQRAIHAILHGRWGEAWSYNAALPFAVVLAGLYAWHPRRLASVLDSPAFICGIALAIIAWWIGRNIIP